MRGAWNIIKKKHGNLSAAERDMVLYITTAALGKYSGMSEAAAVIQWSIDVYAELHEAAGNLPLAEDFDDSMDDAENEQFLRDDIELTAEQVEAERRYWELHHLYDLLIWVNDTATSFILVGKG